MFLAILILRTNIVYSIISQSHSEMAGTFEQKSKDKKDDYY